MIFPHVQIGSFEILDITECLPYLMLLEPLLNSNLEDTIVKDAKNMFRRMVPIICLLRYLVIYE